MAVTDQVVVFRVGGERYGLPIGQVREVVAWTPPTPLPGARAVVEGVLRLRDEVVAVVDLGRRLGADGRRGPEGGHILVVEWDGQAVGLAVDEVTDVTHLGQAQVAPPAAAVRGAEEGLVSGIVRQEERLLLLLDLPRVLEPAREAARAGVAAGGAADG